MGRSIDNLLKSHAGHALMILHRKLFGAVEAQFEGYNRSLDTWDQVEFDQIASEVRPQLYEETLAAAWAAGRALTLEQAIEETRQVTP